MGAPRLRCRTALDWRAGGNAPISLLAGCSDRVELQRFMTVLPIWGDPKHRDPAMCHKWGYFSSTLMDLLEEVGMREITFMQPRYHFPFRDMRVECVK